MKNFITSGPVLPGAFGEWDLPRRVTSLRASWNIINSNKNE